MNDDKSAENFSKLGWALAIILSLLVVFLVYTYEIAPQPNDLTGTLIDNNNTDCNCNNAVFSIGNEKIFNFNFNAQNDPYELNGKWFCGQLTVQEKNN